MAIIDWPEEERPREKLLAKGPRVLSDAELLAIFLRTGINGKTALDLARDLLQRFEGCVLCWKQTPPTSARLKAWGRPSMFRSRPLWSSDAAIWKRRWRDRIS